MPYYVSNVQPFARLEMLAEFPAFRDALDHAKALRLAPQAAAGRIKVMFADDPQQAEDLLCQIHEPGPSGDE